AGSAARGAAGTSSTPGGPAIRTPSESRAALAATLPPVGRRRQAAIQRGRRPAALTVCHLNVVKGA
ncbi:MAG: hypothetical protein M3477_03325, partial [Gemmatimonadota bacterium]|nr:hypothetical protein [Gemmatimonadota bacterium]